LIGFSRLVPILEVVTVGSAVVFVEVLPQCLPAAGERHGYDYFN
jgi:hypothetical protein